MPQETETRTELLEDVVAKLRFYLEKHTEFLLREKEEGREFKHWVSPRVAHAYKDLQTALDRLDAEGDHDAV